MVDVQVRYTKAEVRYVFIAVLVHRHLRFENEDLHAPSSHCGFSGLPLEHDALA